MMTQPRRPRRFLFFDAPGTVLFDPTLSTPVPLTTTPQCFNVSRIVAAAWISSSDTLLTLFPSSSRRPSLAKDTAAPAGSFSLPSILSSNRPQHGSLPR